MKQHHSRTLEQRWLDYLTGRTTKMPDLFEGKPKVKMPLVPDKLLFKNKELVEIGFVKLRDNKT